MPERLINPNCIWDSFERLRGFWNRPPHLILFCCIRLDVRLLLTEDHFGVEEKFKISSKSKKKLHFEEYNDTLWKACFGEYNSSLEQVNDNCCNFLEMSAHSGSPRQIPGPRGIIEHVRFGPRFWSTAATSKQPQQEEEIKVTVLGTKSGDGSVPRWVCFTMARFYDGSFIRWARGWFYELRILYLAFRPKQIKTFISRHLTEVYL